MISGSVSPDSLFSLSGFQKSLLISVYQIRRRISAAPRPTLTKGNPLFPASPFVPRPACFLLLRRVSPCFPLLHSYRVQLASYSCEGSASFSRPTIRIPVRQALPPTKDIPLFPATPSVPQPACSLYLRRVNFLFASHSRIPARQALPLTKGIPLFPTSPFVQRPACSLLLRRVSPCFLPHPSYRVQQAPATTKGQLPSRLPPFVSLPGRLCLLRRVPSVSPPHPSYRVQLASCSYEGSASFSPPTIRILARQALPLTKGILLFPAIPFVPRPACFLHLRRVSFLLASHHSYPRPPRLSDATTKRKSRAFRPASPQGLHPLQQPALKILFYSHCTSLSTALYPFTPTAPVSAQ